MAEETSKGAARARAGAARGREDEVQERQTGYPLMPNVRVKPPAEAGSVSLVRDDAPCAADQAYAACRSGSA